MAREAIQVLYQEIDVIDTVRFLNQFTLGYGDCMTKQDTLFANVTLDDILSNIKTGRKQAGESNQASRVT